MRRKFTKEEFIQNAQKTHGDKYDYSHVEYVDSKTKVCIVCPIHGEFWQTPSNHIRGYGCKECGVNKLKKTLYGVGINDYEGRICDGIGKVATFYTTWANMIARCYSNKVKNKNPTYNDCYSCEKWHRLKNFKVFFDDNYKDGYDLDKDLLVKGNKVYSPETCVFLPREINSFLSNKYTCKNKLYAGITWRESIRKYQVRIGIEGNSVHLGVFENIDDVVEVYKKAREQEAKKLANKYKHEIDIRAYNALMEYKE